MGHSIWDVGGGQAFGLGFTQDLEVPGGSIVLI